MILLQRLPNQRNQNQMLRLKKSIPPPTVVYTLPLPNGQKALVDRENWVWLSQWSWHLRRSKQSFYVCRKKIIHGQEIVIRLHRQITHCPNGFEVHHINGNTLDNRRINLQILETTQHRQYRDFYKSV